MVELITKISFKKKNLNESTDYRAFSISHAPGSYSHTQEPTKG